MGEVPLLYHTKCNTDTQLTKIFCFFLLLRSRSSRYPHTLVFASHSPRSFVIFVLYVVRRRCCVCCVCVWSHQKHVVLACWASNAIFFTQSKTTSRMCSYIVPFTFNNFVYLCTYLSLAHSSSHSLLTSNSPSRSPALYCPFHCMDLWI